MDDIFVLFRKEEHLELYLNYFNSCHENIKFTSEKETNNKLSFLDIEISRGKNQFITSVYCKLTFSGVFSHFDSFIPRGYKFNLVSTLIFCHYSICCSMELFHKKIMQLKEIFEKNGYDNKFFDRCLQTFLNKIYSKKVPQHTVPKTDLYIFFPYLGKLSLSARSTLEKTIRDILPCVNLKVVFRIKNRLSSKFTFKDKISKEMRSLLCYKFQCSSCNATYYGKTKRHFKVRVSEHMGVSARTGKNIKCTKISAVLNHMLVCNNIVSFENFSVLANGTNDFRIKLRESLRVIVLLFGAP